MLSALATGYGLTPLLQSMPIVDCAKHNMRPHAHRWSGQTNRDVHTQPALCYDLIETTTTARAMASQRWAAERAWRDGLKTHANCIDPIHKAVLNGSLCGDRIHQHIKLHNEHNGQVLVSAPSGTVGW
jgi:hypothetical protein